MFCLDVYTVFNIYTDQLITLKAKTIKRIMFCYYEWEICVDCWGYVIGYGHLATFHVCILYIPNGRVVVYYINTKWSCCRVLYIPNGRVVVYYIYTEWSCCRVLYKHQMVVLSCTIYTKWSYCRVLYIYRMVVLLWTIYTKWSCTIYTEWSCCRGLYIQNGRVVVNYI